MSKTKPEGNKGNKDEHRANTQSQQAQRQRELSTPEKETVGQDAPDGADEGAQNPGSGEGGQDVADLQAQIDALKERLAVTEKALVDTRSQLHDLSARLGKTNANLKGRDSLHGDLSQQKNTGGVEIKRVDKDTMEAKQARYNKK